MQGILADGSAALREKVDCGEVGLSLWKSGGGGGWRAPRPVKAGTPNRDSEQGRKLGDKLGPKGFIEDDVWQLNYLDICTTALVVFKGL